MKILIVSAYFFPYQNPRAHRWTAIAREWQKMGHEIHVVTSRGAGFSETEPTDGLQIYRVGFNSLKEIFQYFFRGKLTRGLENPLNKPPRSSWKNRLLQKANDWFWRPFYWPDDASIWQRAARRKTFQLIENQSFDALVTVSLPFTAQLVGLAAKKKWPSLFWLADVGDPLNFQLFPLNNLRFFKQKNERAERLVLQKADAISVTVEALKQRFQNCEPTAQIEVVPPTGQVAFESQVVENQSVATQLASQKKIQIGYFGSFFRGVREPTIFLNFLKSLSENQRDRLSVHFFGDVFDEFLEKIAAEPLIEMHGLVSRAAAAEAMRGMDFLLNIGNRTDFQLPSKAADYWLSGLPILNFCQIERDSFQSFLRDYPLIINELATDGLFSESQIEAVFLFLETNRGRRVAPQILEKRAAELSPKMIAERYLNLILTKKSELKNGSQNG